MKRKVKISLTFDEYSILLDILRSTQECMEYDEDMAEYTAGCRFMYSLEEEEYKTLMNMNLNTIN